MSGGGDTPRQLILWTIAAVAGAVIVVWLLYLAREVLLLVYVSALFAIGFSPVVRLIERQRVLPIGTRRLPRWLAILVVYLGILGVLTGIGTLVVPPLVRQARQFTADLPRLVEQTQQYLVTRGILSEPITWQQAIQQAPGGTDAVGTVLGALWGFLGGIVGVLTILILTFYLLVEAEALVSTFVRLFPRRRRAQVAAVSREITLKVSAWLGGQLFLAGVIGSSAALALGLLGVPYFYVLALIAAIGEMIPVVGPVLAAIPGIAVAWSVSGKLALGVATFYVIQQQVENHVLVPKLMERQLGVSAATVIIALLVGSSLLGIVGALLAVPTAAIAQVLFQELVLREEGGAEPEPPAEFT
ncbi:MAG TPA: AI-2E family transporter [Methylomirabilota bacterium]|nr:AI-2E family transporter [Methylomirabilota bacterium]